MADSGELNIFKTLCEQIKKAVDPSLAWEWDSRFGVSMIVFDAKQSKEIYEFIVKEFSENWGADSIGKAPKIVKTLADQILGIRRGQLLFTMSPHDMVVFFGAWWPWESGANVSLRIGMRPIEGSKYAEAELEKNIREWFGLGSE